MFSHCCLENSRDCSFMILHRLCPLALLRLGLALAEVTIVHDLFSSLNTRFVQVSDDKRIRKTVRI